MSKRESFIDRHQLWPFYRKRKFSEGTLETVRWTEQRIAEGYVPPDDVQISRDTRHLYDGYDVLESPEYLEGRQRMIEQGYDVENLDLAIGMLCRKYKLPSQYSNHRLKGNMRGYKGCDIGHDWLLVYRYDHDRLILHSLDMGTTRNRFTSPDVPIPRWPLPSPVWRPSCTT